ncbi:MAG: signal peptidase II [Selenomonadaceae bacterium]|nr:signal peptidase II [Selenomonadaceae bacterium]
MKKFIRFLQNILLVIELIFYVAYLHIEKVIFFGIIALDQYVKVQVMENMYIGESIPLVQNVFHITFVANPGAAFGILPYQRAFLISLGVVILAAGIFYYTKIKIENPLIKFAGIFAASGALANMIDRIRIGFVVDWFEVCGFPVFNIADVAIVIGMFMMMYVVIFQSEKSNNIKEVRQP